MVGRGDSETLESTPEGETDGDGPFREAVGWLMQPATMTRPNMVNAVRAFERVFYNPYQCARYCRRSRISWSSPANQEIGRGRFRWDRDRGGIGWIGADVLLTGWLRQLGCRQEGGGFRA